MIKIIGAGLAGCEAALALSALGHKCILFDCKPNQMTAAHKSADFGELVCSNSLKGQDISTAGGLLKQELRVLGSPLVEIADGCAVPAGGALAVDRDEFSKRITQRVLNDPNIEFVSQLVGDFQDNQPTIIATGPLTLPPLSEFLEQRLGGSLHFFDAAAPIVSADSIDFESAFFMDRYGKSADKNAGKNTDISIENTNINSDENASKNSDKNKDENAAECEGAYINCPLTKDEYAAFVAELVAAETAIKREFEKRDIFEGCMPVEEMARRGADTLRFGPLKPVGLFDRTGKRPYAVVQLRKENAQGTMYNIVGFQTNLKFGEQQRVFGMIPALKNAEFLRFGVMHRNSYINAPSVLTADFSLKNSPLVFIAGQLSGVEGYCESIMSGHLAALGLHLRLKNRALNLPADTMCGALSQYITTENKNFQPMNANFGLLPPSNTAIRDKKERKLCAARTALDSLTRYKSEILP